MHSQFHSQFHSRRYSLHITLKYTTLVRMRSSYAWTMKPWQWSKWRLGFNSVLAECAHILMMHVFLSQIHALYLFSRNIGYLIKLILIWLKINHLYHAMSVHHINRPIRKPCFTGVQNHSQFIYFVSINLIVICFQWWFELIRIESNINILLHTDMHLWVRLSWTL